MRALKLVSPRLLTQELRRQPKRWQLVLLACNLLIAVFVSWLTPQLSPAVLQFLQRVFMMESILDVVLLNDFLSLYMLIYWLIFFELLAILVIPAEEGYLSLFLSKPLTRRQYLLTRLLPVLGIALTLSLVLMLGSAGAILILNRPAHFSWGSFLAGAGICLSLGLFMSMLVQSLLLWLRDTYNALLVAFFCLILPVLPSSLLMYRPDLFEASPALRWWLVFPANLIWLGQSVIPLAALLIPALLLLSAALLWQTTEQLEQQDFR